MFDHYSLESIITFLIYVLWMWFLSSITILQFIEGRNSSGSVYHVVSTKISCNVSSVVDHDIIFFFFILHILYLFLYSFRVIMVHYSKRTSFIS